MLNLKPLKSGTDVRGTAMGEGCTLSAEAARALGAGFAAYMKGRNQPLRLVSIGRDSRLSGEALLGAFADGLRAMGVDVTSFGLCTTPAMFMSLDTDGFQADAAVMVTASHHPREKNGFKFILPDGAVESDELDGILACAEEIEVPAVLSGALSERDYLPAYKELLKARVMNGLDTDVAKPLLGLHILVDAGNGAGGFYADMLEELGAWVEGSQFLDPDGTFPNHIPNPENEAAMASVSAAVVKYGADLGVIFDADCDRAAIVDSTGRAINRNRLIALISAILLNQKPGATIVTDSVTSSGLQRFITEWGGVHYRFKRGYKNVIDEAIRLNEAGIDCPLAIETSGHAALRENHFLDDGMYLATVLIVEAMRLKQEGKELGSLLDGLREPLESAEVRLTIKAADFRAAGRAAIAGVMDYATFAEGWQIAPDNREGIRINFNLNGGLDNGWFLLRLSVHDPVLPLNIESDVQGGVLQIAGGIYQALKDNADIDLSALEEFMDQTKERQHG